MTDPSTSTDATPASQPVWAEEGIVQTYLAPLARGYAGAYGLRDDCAALTVPSGMDLVVKTDPVMAGVHFLPDDDPADIAWKALAVNVSDLASKAAEPIAYLMALALPGPPTHEWMKAFALGLEEAQRAFGCHLVGGDTDRTTGPLTISVTVFGSVPAGRMVQRGAARVGDLLYVSGPIGDAALGLRLRRDFTLATAWGLSPDRAERLVRRYLRPQPALHLRRVIASHASAAMDLSDGLAKDLGRMCRASGTGAVVRAADVPLSAEARAVVSRGTIGIADLVTGGDDYEVLMAVPRSNCMAFERDTSLAPIGEVVAGRDASFVDGDGKTLVLTRTGWDHFDRS